MLITNIIDLRKKSEKAKPNEVCDIIEKLELELSKHKTGIGLSAIQIGIIKRIAIIRMPNLKIDLINPVLCQRYDRFKFKGESCLSLAGLAVDTLRYGEIVVINNDKEKLVFTRLEAIVVQHEIAHMNGRTIIDDKWRKRWQKILDKGNKKYKSRDRCMTDKEIENYEEGWKLFKEYFFDLWD